MHVRLVSWFMGVLVSVASLCGQASSDVARDIARIHVEALGGMERLEKLTSLRAGGETVAGGQTVDFQMWARRPNAVRLEVESNNLMLIQAWDGEGKPWMQAGEESPAREMPPVMADAFKADAEFDDPLFRPEERGYVLDYAGEDEVGGRPVVKLIATRSASDQSVLYLAADTYFIVRQDRVHLRPDGSRTETQVFYGDFRPVAGVIFPHKVITWVGDDMVSDTSLSWMEPNPPAEDSLFTMPE